MAAQYLLLYEMSLPYGLDLNNQINVDKSATQVSAILDNMKTTDIRALMASADQWLRTHSPNIKTTGAGAVVMFAHLADRTIKSMIKGILLALVGISLLLILALRSLKLGLVSLVPNLIPLGIAFGVWGILVGEVGFTLSTVMGITLGIIVDDTVHFLSKYLRARREQGLSSEDSVRYAFNSVGSAMVVTSLVHMLKFFEQYWFAIILLIPSLTVAQGIEFSGYFALESRVFPQSPLLDEQYSAGNLSLSLQPEFYHEWSQGYKSILFVPYTRVDQHTGDRTHYDIRELYYQKV